jgi:hypothetical protein
MAIQPHSGLGEMLQRIAHNEIVGYAMFDPSGVEGQGFIGYNCATPPESVFC